MVCSFSMYPTNVLYYGVSGAHSSVLTYKKQYENFPGKTFQGKLSRETFQGKLSRTPFQGNFSRVNVQGTRRFIRAYDAARGADRYPGMAVPSGVVCILGIVFMGPTSPAARLLWCSWYLSIHPSSLGRS
jgi:hypothetical protein